MSKVSRKRHRSDSDSDSGLERKIRKLKKKLGRLKGRKKSESDRTSSSSEEEINWRDRPSTSAPVQAEHYTSGSEEGEIVEENREIVLEDQPSELKEDILVLLGSNVAKKDVLGPPLQVDLADRWLNIMRVGLSEEERLSIIQRYPAPSNCQLLRAPKLNPLASAAISDSVTRRDNRLQALQRQIGTSLTAIGQVLTSILKEEEGVDRTRQHIQSLSDAGRLLADIHHAETMSRRELAAYNLNKGFKGTITEAPVDEWLFGADFDERVKATKERERAALQLKMEKPKQTRRPITKNLNFRGPPQAPPRGVGRGGHRQQTKTPHKYKNQGHQRQQTGHERYVRTYRRREENRN